MTDNTQPLHFRPYLLISAAVVIVMALISTYAWFQLPNDVPVCTHWNARGVCDGWGSKGVGLFLMPAVVAGVALLFAVLPHVDPRRANLARSGKAYAAVWMAMLAFFLIFHVIVVLQLLGVPVIMGALVPALTGVLFIAIGAALGKVKSNYFFGIRTPWTLSSELSWQKTHRLGGWLFVAAGALIVVGALALPQGMWVVLMTGVLVALIVTLAVYSYLVWKRDPARG